MTMTLWEAKKEIAAWCYDVGRFIGCGDVVKDLLARDGPMATRKLLSAALRSANGNEYVRGAIRQKNQKSDADTPDGTRMGMYEKRGNKWVQWIEKFDYDRLPPDERAKYASQKT